MIAVMIIMMKKMVMMTMMMMVFTRTQALTGHVCRRMARETYLVKDTRAFLCNERYTTSCGHLDWRRCTRYRVQTCYGPKERYATRFREVEECCPGWQQAAGSCTIPVCHGVCQNGGACSQSGAVPHCSCLPGYYGDLCQHERGTPSTSSSSSPTTSTVLSPAWIIVIVIVILVVVAVTALVAVYMFRKRLKLSPTSAPSTSSPTGSPAASPSTSTSTPSSSSNTPTKETHNSTPLVTVSGSLMTPRIVQPSAPSTSKEDL